MKTDHRLLMYSLMTVACFLMNIADAGTRHQRAPVDDQSTSSPVRKQSQESSTNEKDTSSEGPSSEVTEDEILIATFQGSGTTITRPFKVNGPWELRWDFGGPFFTVTIYKADGSVFDIGASQEGPAKGSSYQPKRGNYYLKIITSGNWKLKVVEIRQPGQPTPKIQEYKPRLNPKFFSD